MSQTISILERVRAFLNPPARAEPSSAVADDRAPAPGWPDDVPDFVPPSDVEADLIALDQSYAGMYRLHRSSHEGLIAEVRQVVQERGARRFLEVAPGTGWIARHFVEAAPQYWALELNEAAVKLLVRRFPSACVLNCAIEDADVIASSGFDVVFCASMLEHIGDHEAALNHLIRITAKDLFIVFYEGLVGDNEQRFEHRPFDNPDWRRFHGVKFLTYQDRHGGYFMKRYARSTIDAIVRAAGATATYLDASNRPYLANETVLHIRKGPRERALTPSSGRPR